MARSQFKGATSNEKPCWFTSDEVRHLDMARIFRSRPDLVWDMKDASFSIGVDVIAIKCKNHCISLSKRLDPVTEQPVYDIASDGEKARTFKSFAELEMVFARALQLRSGPDHLWARIEASIRKEEPGVK